MLEKHPKVCQRSLYLPDKKPCSKIYSSMDKEIKALTLTTKYSE